MTMFAPASEIEAIDIVRAARADRTPLAIEGGGTRAGLGRPTQAGATLSTRALAGITLYNPAEMTLVARAGTGSQRHSSASRRVKSVASSASEKSLSDRAAPSRAG